MVNSNIPKEDNDLSTWNLPQRLHQNNKANENERENDLDFMQEK